MPIVRLNNKIYNEEIFYQVVCIFLICDVVKKIMYDAVF